MIDSKVLYEVNAPDFETVATCVVIRSGPDFGWVGFHDTRRGNMMDGVLLEETPDGFVWEWHQQDPKSNYELRPTGQVQFRALSLERFEEKWREKLSAGKLLPKFKGKLELWVYFAEICEQAGYPY